MTSLKLFKINSSSAEELHPCPPPKEKSIQSLIEAHMPTLLGIRFLASEYSTGKKHGGRIDTLGLDENNNPVILEYKRHTNENVINQGLYYLDWLLDHKAEFELLSMKTLNDQNIEVDWSSPRLLCIASDFTKYDSYAVEQINRNIELIRYKLYDNSTQLLLELVNSVQAENAPITSSDENSSKYIQKTVSELYQQAGESIKALVEDLDKFIFSLGDDVTKKELKLYYAYKKISNIVCLEVQMSQLKLCLKLNPDDYSMEDGFLTDLRGKGHWGTGDLQILIKTPEDLERAYPIIRDCYDKN